MVLTDLVHLEIEDGAFILHERAPKMAFREWPSYTQLSATRQIAGLASLRLISSLSQPNGKFDVIANPRGQVPTLTISNTGEIVRAVICIVGNDPCSRTKTILQQIKDVAVKCLGPIQQQEVDLIRKILAQGLQPGNASEYLSLAEADWENAPELPETFREDVRKTFSGKILYAGKYTAERGNRVIQAGWGDLIAFGRPFIANPDLPARLANGWSLNPVDPTSMYGGTDKGYTDYPTYSA